MDKLKVLKKSDNVSLCFGEWFDKSAGNTYYDVQVIINSEVFEVPYQYGYNAGDIQSIDEALKYIGYRVRKSAHRWTPYDRIHTYTTTKLKRELFK